MLRDLVGDLARGVFADGAVTVAVKTNLGPEFEVGEGGGAFASALGVKAAVIVRDRAGRELFSYGEAPATNPVLVATLLAATALAGFFLVRGLVKQ